MELLERLWEIPPSRLATELAELGVGMSLDERLGELSDAERSSAADYFAFLAARHAGRGRGRRPGRSGM